MRGEGGREGGEERGVRPGRGKEGEGEGKEARRRRKVLGEGDGGIQCV